MGQNEIDAMFPWWAVARSDDPDAARKRALAWLDGPYASVAAKTRYVVEDETDDLFDLVRFSIVKHDVPDWESPVEFEAWLQGLLQGCATKLNLD
jgi:hypothetical protein